MRTVVVEKDARVTNSSSSFSYSHSYFHVVPGDAWHFRADHWHEVKLGEYSGSKLEVVDSSGNVVASFNSGHWDRVYFKESLA